MPLIAVYILLRHMGYSLRRAFRNQETRGLVYLAFIVLGLGTIFYRAFEGLSWVDALYFSVVTLTTVGYGDFVPVTDGGKLFTILYILVGLGIIAKFIVLLAQSDSEATEPVEKNKDPKAAERVDDGSQKD
jgi:voltage-gated potassium channel Kch